MTDAQIDRVVGLSRIACNLTFVAVALCAGVGLLVNLADVRDRYEVQCGVML